MLLRSLISGGYLHYDAQGASYYLTLRVFHLGGWLPDAGAVAAAFCPAGATEPLVIGVGGPTFRVRRNEAMIAAELSASLARVRG